MEELGKIFKWALQIFSVTLLLFYAAWMQATPTQANFLSELSSEPALPRPQAIGVASISLNAPGQVFLGEDVAFSVTFDNTGADEGYGPFIDVYLDSTGADGDDGIGVTNITATYQGSPIPAGDFYVLTFDAAGQATHPILRDASGAFVAVAGDPGDRLVVVRLPFGSFTPDQPPATINFSVDMSTLADLNVPLTLRARGGYQFGQTPLDDWCCGDPPDATLSAWQNGSVTPTLLSLSKSYSGPEDETATGANFPRQYTVSATIAPGQSLTSFTLVDALPANMQFVSIAGTVPGGAACTTPSTSMPGGTISCVYPGAVSGTVSLTFNFFIPRLNSSADNVIDPATGNDVISCNEAQASGSWVPVDPRDPPAVSTVNPGGCEHTLTDKALAVQKGVTVLGGGSAAPTRTLVYTLDFQVSDFFAFDNVVLTDTLSDGQRFDTSFIPTLQVNGNNYSLPAAAIDLANFTISCNYTGATLGAGCDVIDPAANDGTTTIAFNISAETLRRAGEARLIGGCVDPVNGSAAPDCAVYNDGATTGQIVFRTVIQEEFSDDFPSGDPSVDQGDTLTDILTLTGQVLNTATFAATGNLEDDDSRASVAIPRGDLEKSIYAVNGSTTFSLPVRVNPTDTITYRIRYTLTTSDIESLVLRDWLPLPVFYVGDPDDDGAPGPTWSFDPTVSAAAPAPGVAKFGPEDTFTAYSGIIPTVASDVPNNALIFTYGDYDDPRNQPTIVDILFTVTVSNDPFADGLYLTNQALASEGSTNSGAVDASAIVQFILQEPVLVSTKGVIWSSNANSGFTPTPPGPVTFLDPANAPRWNPANGIINSSTLDAQPIDSNLSGVDAGDIVTFAILIRNTGSSLRGAFDIILTDTLQAQYQIPATSQGLNLQVYYGNGTGPIAYIGLGGGPDGVGNTADDLFGNGIELVDPNPSQGVCQAHDPNLGNDIIVITYDLQLRDDVTPGDVINTASLLNYSGTEGGPNYLPEPLRNSATVSVDQPQIAKTLLGSEIDNAFNFPFESVIGEVTTYQVVITVPEGQLPAAQMVDSLESGLALVSCLSVTPSSADLTTDYPGGFGAMCAAGTNPSVNGAGDLITFDLGTLTNNNRDNDASETITFTYNVVVLNQIANQAGITLSNVAELRWTGGSISATTDEIFILEPTLTITKTATPATADAGDTITFNVTIANGNGSNDTDAFDLTWTDLIPAAFIYVPGSFAVGACTAPAPTISESAAPLLTATWSSMAPGQSCTLTFNVTVAYTANPGQTYNNTAEVRWTSLSGAPGQRSTFNAASTERTGEDNLPGPGVLNDYRRTATGGVTIAATAPQKFLVATSELHTSPGAAQYVAIGEIVRYRIAVQIPEGTIPNFQIRDLLPSGLTFLNDNTSRAVFVSDNGITSTGVGIVPAFNDPACNLVGSTVNATTPAIPGGCVLADNAVGASISATMDDDAFANGTDPYFKFGDLVNNDDDADPEYVVAEFNALINNTVDGSNDAGNDRNDLGRAYVNEIQSGMDSNIVQVRIAEPLLSLTKTAAIDPTQDAGDTAVYTLTITADASNPNRATAFDLELTDTLDGNLTPNTVNISSTQGTVCVGNGAGATAFSATATTAGQLITVTATCLDPGQSLTVTINASVRDSAPAGYTLPNTGNLTYTSLPGASGTAPNPTGSVVTGAPGSGTGERTGSGVAPNDYTASSAASLTLNRPTIDKITPSPAQYTIGQEVTFNLLVTLPEGTTQALTVVDDLPTGLAFVPGSGQVITTAAASGGLLTADFAGTFANNPPTFTALGGSGGDVSWDFGNTVTTGDNNPTNNSFVIQLRAQVLNEAGNQSGASLTNTGILSYVDATNGLTNLTDSETITLIEPVLTIDKAIASLIVTPNPGAGDVVDYAITIQNPAGGEATAYEANFVDALPAQVDLILASITVNAGLATVINNSNDAANTVDLTISEIPIGTTVTITYQATVLSTITPGELVENTGTVTWSSLPGDVNSGAVNGERDGSGGVNDYAASDTASFISSAAATLVKDDGGVTQVVIGQNIHYTLTIEAPLGTVPNAQVVDTLPAGTIYVVGSQTVSANISPATFTVSSPNDGSAPVVLTWDFGDAIVTSSPFTIEYDAIVANVIGNQEGTLLVNDVVFTFENASGNTITLTATENETVVEPVLNITKTANNLTPGANEVITYSLVVSHDASSNANAFDVVVSDVLPAGVNYVAGSAAPLGWSPNYNPATRTLTFTGDLPLASGSVTLTYQASIDPSVPIGSNLTNNAAVVWTSTSGANSNERNGSDGVGSGLNNYASETALTITFTSVDLAILKDDGGATTTPGGVVIYTLDYANNGNADATNVIITETVPAYTVFNQASSTAGWSCLNGAPAGSLCSYTVGALAPGESGSVDFALTAVNPIPAGVDQIENTARIAGTEEESNLANNEDSDTTPIAAVPVLEVVKDDGVTIVSPEQTLTYTITVANTGDQGATGVLLTDTLPAEVIFLSASDSGSESGGVVTWPTFALDAGASRSFSLTVRVKNEVDLQGATQMTNWTRVQDDGSNTDGTPVVDDDDDTDQIAYARVKALIATSEPDSFDLNPAREPVFIGEILTYEINLLVPEGDLPNLTAVDVLDPGLAFVGCQSISYGTLTTTLSGGFEAACNDPVNPTVSAEPSGSANSEFQGRRITFNLGDVSNPPGSGDQLLTIQYQAVVLNIAANINGRAGLKNGLTWTWASGSLTGSASTPVVEVIEPILQIEKSVSSTVVLTGEEVTFRINISHTSESRANAYDVLITDVIPSGLSYVPNSATTSGTPPTSLTYNASTRTLSASWDTFPLGASASLTFRAIFSGSTFVTNTAWVTWTSLPADLPTSARLTEYNTTSTERHFEPTSPGGVNSYGRNASTSVSLVQQLPATGFAPGIRTAIPAQPEALAYTAMGDVRLEIPALNLNLPVTGIPRLGQSWDLTWLANQVGYLEGTAYPGTTGNTALTAHTYLADGNPGPFVNLHQLVWGQTIILHTNGYQYIYEVRQNQLLYPQSVSVLYSRDGHSWLTLITCKGFNENTGAYTYRTVVRAVLVKIEPEP